MAHTDASKETLSQGASALILEDSWFQKLPHLGNVHPYGLAVARAKAQLLKDYMDGADRLSPALSPPGEMDKKVGAADG